MAIIKVTYNSISRRFNVDSSTTWVDLESNLRSLYNIPATSSLTVSYTDEDGDIITLSSDLELKEVISQHLSGKPIKLVLSAANDWVLEDDTKSSNAEVENNLVEDSPQDQTEEKQTTDREEENVESRPPSYYQHVSINDEEEEPEFEQTTPLLNKEKENEEQHPEKTEDTETRPEKENKEKNEEDDDEDDEIIFIFSHHPAFFGPRFGPRFGGFGGFGPRFGGFGGFFGGPRFGLFDGLFSPFNFYGRQQFYRPAFFHDPSVYYFNPRQCGPNACGQKSNAYSGNSKPSCCSKQQTTSNNSDYAESSSSATARNNGCDKNNCKRSSRTSCGQNFNYFHPRYYNQTPITQEQLNEKLSTLHSMGFDSSNNALYEDLLKRYNGNLDRVIELLLRNQQINEHYDNEKTSTSESKKVESEESKPYVL